MTATVYAYADPADEDYDDVPLDELDVDWVVVERVLRGDVKAKKTMNQAEWQAAVRTALVDRRWTVTQTARVLHTRNGKVKDVATLADIPFVLFGS